MARKQAVGEMEDEMVAVGDAVRVYELGFHLDPELGAEEVKKAYQAVREVIGTKSTIVAEGEPQTVQLAYTISRQETSGRRDFNSAYFCWIAYETSTDHHTEILAAANADKRVVRFIDLLTTKDAARHAVEIREFVAKAQEHVDEPEATVDVELDAALQKVAV